MMTRIARTSRRRWILPEAIQISAMDCGPASLQCLLAGYGIRVSYGRLREICQTEIDGTSIDTLEAVAVQLGLDAEQVLLPADNLFVPDAPTLPAIAVVRLPDGMAHFVVVWNRCGRFLQIVDPGTGRRWSRCEALVDQLHQHVMPVPADAWRRWMESDEAVSALRHRLKALGIGERDGHRLVTQALEDVTWRGPALLDAAIRMTTTLVAADGVPRGERARRVLESLRDGAAASPEAELRVVPPSFWSVRPTEREPGDDGPEHLLARGAVLVRVRGRRPNVADAAPGPLSSGAAAALEEPPERPLRDLLRMFREGGLLAPTVAAGATIVAAASLVVQAIVFRGVLPLVTSLAIPEQRLGVLGLLVAFLALTLLLEWPIASAVRRFGRHLEVRVRLALARALPRIHDRYFRSRLVSDMADRSHVLHQLRSLPDLCGGFLRSAAELVLTIGGIAWIRPSLAPIAILAGALVVTAPLLVRPLLSELDLRTRSHGAALGQFYLDALLGLVAIRAHGAERTLKREHDAMLSRWVRASTRLLRASVVIDAVVLTVGIGAAAALVFAHGARDVADAGGLLLLVYWALRLPSLGQDVVAQMSQLLAQRNVAKRAIEPIGAEQDAAPSPKPTAPSEITASGVAIRLERVNVVAAGHPILRDVDLEIAPGEHVAIVGKSGAGKSSLVSLLLGWHRASSGRVLVDGEPLEGERLHRARGETAWVDPAVHLWNRALLQNLTYGSGDEPRLSTGELVDAVDLRALLQSLPSGLQTPLGESGALVSGGEGQRVRLARALGRPAVRLAILDEPFRGLDVDRRRELLARCRTEWRDATLLCVTHDLDRALAFDRVVVVEDGRIVETVSPKSLAGRADSVFAAMLRADTERRVDFESEAAWRRLRLERGALVERHEKDLR
ncbi:MAG: ATP-binding cassette domain-containing protein [Planctomycetes bacterium]|nr:ATP-binding cassette domain-containing protein [Planctomycetota bacterium]MBI3843949.1 ATP-binding cassette domain-containing protein [Planctomycetota bacterium]